VARRDTRRQIILAAERLFAERGLAGVSLREINVAAGQRNTSAAHYHFGSKEALVDAIFEFRRSEIGRRREEILDTLHREGKATELRALTRALIEPLGRELQPEAEDGAESYYLPFLAHLFLQSPQEVADILRRHRAAEQRWSQLVQDALPQVPRDVLFTRLYLMGRHVVVSLASYQRLGLGWSGPDFELYLGDMTDSVAGYISAPVSEHTVELAQARAAQRKAQPPPARTG
jgi:AcrR family transcriptional regulator